MPEGGYRRVTNSRSRKVPFFEWEGPLVWGLAGMFLRDLVEALR